MTGSTPPLTVYWRPGCGFCMRLFRTFEKAGVHAERRNIWDDDEARAFVAGHNRGNEIVPTVALGDEVLTNPDPKDFVARLAEQYPSWSTTPRPSPPVAPGATASACGSG